MTTPITSTLPTLPPTVPEYLTQLMEDPDMQVLMAAGAVGITAITLVLAAEGLDRLYGWFYSRRETKLPQPAPNILNQVLGLYSTFANLNGGPIPVSNREIPGILVRFSEILDANAASVNELSIDTIAELEERVAIAIGRVFYGRQGGKEIIRQLYWDLGDGVTNTAGQQRLQEITKCFLDRNDLIPPDDGSSQGPKIRRPFVPLTVAPDEDVPDDGDEEGAVAGKTVYLDEVAEPVETYRKAIRSFWHLRGASSGIAGRALVTRNRANVLRSLR